MACEWSYADLKMKRVGEGLCLAVSCMFELVQVSFCLQNSSVQEWLLTFFPPEMTAGYPLYSALQSVVEPEVDTAFCPFKPERVKKTIVINKTTNNSNNKTKKLWGSFCVPVICQCQKPLQNLQIAVFPWLVSYFYTSGKFHSFLASWPSILFSRMNCSTCQLQIGCFCPHFQ